MKKKTEQNNVYDVHASHSVGTPHTPSVMLHKQIKMKKYNPDIATTIYKFFSVEYKDEQEYQGLPFPRSILNLVDFTGVTNLVIHQKFIQKYLANGYLMEVFTDAKNPLTGKHFISLELQKHIVNAGGMNCFANGWIYTKQKVSNSIYHLVNTRPNDDYESGTAFLTEENIFLTAKHCVENTKKVELYNSKKEITKVKGYWYDKTTDYDIAILDLGQKFGGLELKTDNFKLLDPILTIGYPSISRLDAFQVISTGELIAFETTYRENQPTQIINARLKGGFSGAPVFNKFGFVIGMLIQIPNDSKNKDQYDPLGFGFSLPSNLLNNVKQKVINESNDIEYVKIEYAA